MLKSIEKTGKTEDEAVKAALAELKLDRDDVQVEIIARAKSGFLGIGASPAIVRVSYEVPDEPKPAVSEPKPEVKKEPKKAPAAPKAEAPAAAPAAPADPDEPADFAAIRSFLEGLLQRMNVKAEIEITRRDNDGINVNLSGSGMGAIIGRRGETLDAIQHLTNYVVNRDSDKHLHISVDAEAYRSKREESLTHLAEKMAEKAIKYKRPMALEPMNSYERHVIHTALQNYEGVTTASTGVEPNRRVVVSYVRPDRPERTERPKTAAKPVRTETPARQEAPAAPAEPAKSNKPVSREWV